MCLFLFLDLPAGIHLLKVKNGNLRTSCRICSKSTIKIPERRQWRRSGIFIVNFEHIIASWDVAFVSIDLHIIHFEPSCGLFGKCSSFFNVEDRLET